MRKLCGYHVFSIGILVASFFAGLIVDGFFAGIVLAVVSLLGAVPVFSVEIYFAPDEPTLWMGDDDRTIPPHPW